MSSTLNRCIRLYSVALFGALLALTTSYAHAQIDVYNNLGTFSGVGYSNGQAATYLTDGLTLEVADELNLAPGYAGSEINGFTFTAGSFNTSDVSARALVRFYDDSGPSGQPGSLLAEFKYELNNLAPDTNYSFSESGGFTVPADDTVWAAISFDNNDGLTGASLAQLDELSQGLYNPPTVGSSGDYAWESTFVGNYAANDPAGQEFFFGGNPVANFGWELTVPGQQVTPTPEPGSVALLSAFALTGLGVFSKSRLKKRVLS